MFHIEITLKHIYNNELYRCFEDRTSKNIQLQLLERVQEAQRNF